MPVAALTAIGTAVGADALAIGGGLIGGLETAALGAAVGAGSSAIFGRDPGKGALFGALGGAGQALGPAVGETLGIGKVGGLALTDAATGAIGAGITGGDVGKGALFGGLSGAASGLLGNALEGGKQAGSPDASAPGGNIGGAAAGGAAASTAIGQGGIPDLSAPLSTPVVGSAGIGAGPINGPAAGIENIDVPSGPSSAGANVGALNLNLAGSGDPGHSAVGGADVGVSPGFLSGLQNGGLPGNHVTSPAPIGQPTGSATNAGPTAAAGAAKANSVGTFFHDPTLANLGGIAKANPALVLGGGALAFQAANQPKLPDSAGLTNSLKGQADTLSAEGKTLMNYINTGTLPPGAMAAVTQATQSAKAAVKSRYAGLGLSGSTSEASALAQIDQQASGQIFSFAQSLLEAGIKESGLSTEIYANLLKETDANNATMSSAIANFAASLAGGGSRGISVNVGGTGNG